MSKSPHFAVLTLDIHIPAAHSLKEKRSVVKSLKERLRNKFNISISETGDQELWQRAQITAVMVGNSKSHLESAMQRVLRFAEQTIAGRGEIIHSGIEI